MVQFKINKKSGPPQGGPTLCEDGPCQWGKHKSAFTLVEILIVVVIIGILAAIVIPQFCNASLKSRESALRDDLRAMRTQIVIYTAQHQGIPPGPTDSLFVQQLTSYTDVSGNAAAAADATHTLGPYIPQMPVNPLNALSSILMVSGNQMPSPDESTGWIFNSTTQEIIANSTGSDGSGTPYVNY